MQEYILKRLLLMIPSLIGVSLGIFIIMNLVPGDVVMARLAEAGSFEKENVDRLRHELGLDRPLWERYANWLWGAVRGDLGKSLWTGVPVTDEIFRRIPITLEIALISIAVSVTSGILVGVVSAIRQDTPLDYVGRFFTILGLSIPDFWLATLLLVMPVIWWGYMPSPVYAPFFDGPWENFKQFLPPSIALGARLSASVMRMTRSSLLEVLRQDYIRTAWAKGLRESAVIYRHALKNALIPVVTILGTQLSRLMGGTVVVETIFGLPGVGRLLFESIVNRDYMQLQGNVVFLAVVFLLMNLLVDLSYAWLDPRIKY